MTWADVEALRKWGRRLLAEVRRLVDGQGLLINRVYDSQYQEAYVSIAGDDRLFTRRLCR